MSNVYQFNFEKTYKEIEINGKVFRIEMNDDAQKKYRRSYKEFLAMQKEIMANPLNFETATEEDIEAYDATQLEIAKMTIETFLGEGTFPEIYEMSGRAVVNLTPLMDYITNEIILKGNDNAKDLSKKYQKNGKK